MNHIGFTVNHEPKASLWAQDIHLTFNKSMKIKNVKKFNNSLLNVFNFVFERERDYFIENLSMLVSSGMTILDTIDTIAMDMRSNRMLNIVNEIKKQVESGSPLWQALDNVHIFSPYVISFIRIGEESNKLPDNLRIVGIQQEKERILKAKISSAIIYPVFVLLLALIVGISIAWFVLPKIALVFSQLHIKLPFITKVLINIGLYIEKHGTVVIPLTTIILCILLYIIFYFQKTKIMIQMLLFSFPGIKRIIQEVELSRLGYLLGALLQAGLPITQAISLLAQATIFPHYKKFYEYLVDSIEEGNSFKKSFANYKHIGRLIPTPTQQLIIIGEQSEKLIETLLAIGQTFEIRTEITSKNITVMLEPILLIIVWLGVVLVALSTILPIYNLIGGLGVQ